MNSFSVCVCVWTSLRDSTNDMHHLYVDFFYLIIDFSLLKTWRIENKIKEEEEVD